MAAILEHHNVWIKKATGLGITELILRVMAWLALRSTRYDGHRMHIVTGPRINIAVELVDRIKRLFVGTYPGLLFDTDYVTVKLNGCTIQAFPSHTVDTMRAYTDVSFLFADEADFFPPGQQTEMRDVIERYRIKSNPYIVMVSTPNKPGGLFEKMENEPTSRYHRMKLDYTYGIGKIYDAAFLEAEKQEEYFEREYNLKYLGKVGNVFRFSDISRCIMEAGHGERVRAEALSNAALGQSIGIDPGFGGSAFGVAVTAYADGKVVLLEAEEYERTSYEEALSKCWELWKRYNIKKAYIDASAVSFVKSFKLTVGERSDYENVPREHWRYMKVQPVNFATRHKEMLSYLKTLVEGAYVRIPKDCDKLIVSLKTAFEQDGRLDKTVTAYDDILDATRLAMLHFKSKQQEQTDLI